MHGIIIKIFIIIMNFLISIIKLIYGLLTYIIKLI